MSTDLTFDSGRFSKAVRFVVVNNRVQCSDQHCTLGGGLIEKGYVRDSNQLIYCDTQGFDGWAHEGAPVKNCGRKAS